MNKQEAIEHLTRLLQERFPNCPVYEALQMAIDELLKEPIEVAFDAIPVMASTELGKSEYLIQSVLSEEKLSEILRTKLIRLP